MSRSEFEAWVSAPPYERCIDRYSDDALMWPGQYCSHKTEIAWQAWQARSERIATLEALLSDLRLPIHARLVRRRSGRRRPAAHSRSARCAPTSTLEPQRRESGLTVRRH